MLKLKQYAFDFLHVNVKPECLDTIIAHATKKFEQLPTMDRMVYSVPCYESTYAMGFDITFSRQDFEEVEELKPYVWYPREKFDGNPKGYVIIARDVWEDDGINKQLHIFEDSIIEETTHFMYIESFEGENSCNGRN